MKRNEWLGCVALLIGGCASGPSVLGSKDLPVRSVVLYRSGVGYFERSGSFSGEALEFGVREPAVGDFLASLTAIERTSGGVSSVAFDVPDEETRKDNDRVAVRLMLRGDGDHDVSVAYVVGAPIWRPSYRVVFDEQKDALLQAWAVVQNTSGEDWENVALTLTTGSPISFRSDLGSPITPERPLVSDEGEVIAAVPTAETAVEQGAPAASAPAAMPAPEEAYAMDMAESSKASGPQPKRMRSSRAVAEAAPPPPVSAGALAQSTAPMARIATLEESVTRYEIEGRVTIPDGGSTMVAVVSQRVPGEKAHLFAPDGGVALSAQHPFSVARLENRTGAVLEKGPVSVLGHGAFLGQGVLDTLPKGATAFVPFALDKSLVVERGEHYSEEQGALLRVLRDMVTVERFSQRKTTYTLRNGGTEKSKVYVRHERWGEAELIKPRPGTELSPGKALIPIEVAGHGQVALEVIERTPVKVEVQFFDQIAADAVALWLSGPAVDAAQSEALRKALAIRKELVGLTESLGAVEREAGELRLSADDTRNNLKAIEKVSSAGDLRGRLVGRLKQLDARLAELTKKLVEGRTKQSELEVRLKDALEGVSLNVK